MKKYILILLAALIFVITACEDVKFSDTVFIQQESVIAVKVEPPVVCPGCKMEIFVAADNGNGSQAVVDITLGNIVFAGKNKVETLIPSDISTLFGDETLIKYRKNGFVDIPVEIMVRNSAKSIVKYFRIAKKSDDVSDFAVNPYISSLKYEAIGTAERIEVKNEETIYFSPSSIPDEFAFIPVKTVVDDLIEDEYAFSWYVSGSSGSLPELMDFDLKTGKVMFSFKDDSGAPLIGVYRFYSVLKAKKSFSGTEDARYGSDYFTFVIDTNGE